MSENTRIATIPYLLHTISKYIPYMAILAAFALPCVLFILDKTDSIITISPFLILVIIASIIILIRKKTIHDMNLEIIDSEFSASGINSKIYYKLYAIFFVLTLTWLIYSQKRDTISLFLFFILYALSLLQIFSKSNVNTKFILLQLFLTSTVFTYSQVFCHPYYYSVDDIFPHTRLASGILESGSTLVSEFGGQYTNYSLYHICNAITTMLSGISIQISPYVVMVIPVLTSCIFVYYIAKHLTKSGRIAVAASFCYLMIPVVLRYTTSCMPFVLATLSYIIILYLVFHDSNKIKITTAVVLSVIVTLYMTIVHHMSTPIVIMGIIVLAISIFIYNSKPTIIQKYVISIFIAIPAVYSVYNYLSVIVASVDARIIDQLFFDVSFNPDIQNLLTSNIVEIMTLLSYILTGIITFILLFGLYYLGTRKSIRRKCAVTLPFLFIFVILFIPGAFDLLGIDISIYRFRMMIAPIFAISMGIGCFVIYRSLYSASKQKTIIPKLLAITLGIGLIILSPIYLTSSEADAYIGTENEEVNYLNEHDLTLLTSIKDYIEDGSQIRSDHIIYRYFVATPISGYYNQSYYTIYNDIYQIVSGTDTDIKPVKYTVLRYDLYNRGELEIILTGARNAITFSPDDTTDMRLNNYLSMSSKYYENGFDSIYWNY